MKEKHCFTQPSPQKPGKAMGKYQRKQYQLGPQGAEKPKQEEASSWGGKKRALQDKDPWEGPKSNGDITRLPLPQQIQSACTPGCSSFRGLCWVAESWGRNPRGELKGQGQPKGC